MVVVGLHKQMPAEKCVVMIALGVSAPCYNDVEMLTEFNWDDRNIRRVFIRKVYTILMIQLLVTLAIVALFTFCDPVKDYIQTNPGWYWASYAVFFVTYLTLSCCSAPRRQFPWNLILLVIFVSWCHFHVSCFNSFYNTKSVVMCLGITAAVCLLVTVFSFQTKVRKTKCFSICFCAVVSVTSLCRLFPLDLRHQAITQLDPTTHLRVFFFFFFFFF
uniref:Protein lifeguard 2 n=1 Tax=Amphilophus citrinellus TaxID=61819 RepID=A0A3Q0S389_AMPCI